MPRTDLALALFWAGVTALSRVPFRARLLPSWDAVQFALALRDYDIVKHQPHPPGYILYVALARALEPLAGDATESLTWLALAASAVTVFLVYRLAWMLYGRATASLAAAGLAASPLFWFYGVVGLSYTTEAALATGIATLAWRMRSGESRFAAWSAVALGLAGGVRQSVLILLLPLWVGMAWAGLRRWRPVLSGLAVIALTTAAWFGPMVWLTGGFWRYTGAALELFDSTVRATTIVGAPGAWQANATALLEALVLGLGLLLPVLAGLVVLSLGRVRRWDARAWFFAGWIVPPLGVYTAVHFGQHGYLLTVLPALYILIARGLVVLGRRLGAAWRVAATWLRAAQWATAAAVLAAILLAHAAFFATAAPIEVPGLFAAAPGSEGWGTALRARYRFRLWPTTARGLREQEGVIRAYVDAVRSAFNPANAVVVTELGNPRSYPWFRHVMYYLPEFTVIHLRLGRFSPGYISSRHDGAMAALGDSEIILAANVRRLVWVVDYWNPMVPRPAGLRAYPLAYGRWLYVLDVGRHPVEHAGYRLTPLTAVARLR
ncbi:MAG TPA: hypothetical protein VGW35_20610 [Methylomirabilota bacterium]|jgi:hypothetical protein|nr:hypothetical protein [Methylomirabilota bacterium]